MPVKIKSSHDKCIQTLKLWFEERSIACVDFEERMGNQNIKRPDLLLPVFRTLIEVKTIQPQEQEINEERRIAQDLKTTRITTYWHPEFRGRFLDDLKEARRQFRNFSSYSTAVIFFDFHSTFHRQDPVTLLRGQEYLTVAVPKDPKIPPHPIKSGHNERPLRHDLNNEIGAVIFATDRNTFSIYHNQAAEKIRRLPKEVFSLQQDKHFKYYDDKINPKIVGEK